MSAKEDPFAPLDSDSEREQSGKKKEFCRRIGAEHVDKAKPIGSGAVDDLDIEHYPFDQTNSPGTKMGQWNSNGGSWKTPAPDGSNAELFRDLINKQRSGLVGLCGSSDLALQPEKASHI